MAKLTADEQALLEKLNAKLEAPEESAGSSRNIDILIDLADESAVERAVGFGLLTPAQVKKLEDGDDGKPAEDDGDGDGKKKPAKEPDGGAAPARRGYFDEST